MQNSTRANLLNSPTYLKPNSKLQKKLKTAKSESKMETKHGKLPGNPHEEKPLDPELKNYYVDIKRNIKQDHTTYISSHPEIRQLLNDFMSTLLLHKPEDVFKFTKDYYSFFNKKQDGTTEVQTKKKPPRTEIKPIIMIGPSGVGKVSFNQKKAAIYCIRQPEALFRAK